MEQREEYLAIINKAMDEADELAADTAELLEGLKLMAEALQTKIDDESESAEAEGEKV